MRWTWMLVLCGSAACGSGDAMPGEPDAGPSVDPSAELYDPANLPHFELELPQTSIDALWADPRTYVPGTLHYGAETVANIGVRLKGEWNFRDLGAKAAFKLKFDEFVPDQEFRGLRRMNWNNSLEDPSFVAERLVYDTFRAAGVVAPRANSCIVTVNGELYGVYVNVETEDKHMVGRWFADNDGNIYEETGAEFTAGAEWAFELETNETLNDRSDLAGFIAAFEAAGSDTFLADLAPVLDTEEYLTYSALEGIVNQWDGYSYTQFGPNNFRIYHDPTSGQFSFIPWGMDMSMKPWSGIEQMDIWSIAGLILQRCVASSTCRPVYEQKLRDMVALFESLDLATRAQAYHDQIAADVAADPRKEVDTGTFEATFAGVVNFIATRPAAVRAQLP
jgi:spore coat protein H